ncbi:MAG: hypothetical protein ABIF01_03130 [Candidatus Micrarchaeota archaeon]
MKGKTREILISISLVVASIIFLLLFLELISIAINLETGTAAMYYENGQKASNLKVYSPCSNASENTTVTLVGASGEFKVKVVYNTDHPVRLGGQGEADELNNLEGSFVVASIGDSCTFSYVDPNETFSAVFEAEANKMAGRKTKVLNFGIPALNPNDYLVVLRQSAVRYKPSVILVNIYPGNDILGKREDSSALIALSQKNQSLCSSAGPSLKASLLGIASQSRFFRFIAQKVAVIYHRQLMRDEYYAAYLLDDPERELRYNPVFNTLLEMKRIAAEMNATLIVSILPDAMEIDQSAWDTYFAADKNKYSPDVPQRLIKEFGAREGIIILDPFQEYRVDKTDLNSFYYPIDLHFNKAGNEEFGRELYSQAKEKGVFPN